MGGESQLAGVGVAERAGHLRLLGEVADLERLRRPLGRGARLGGRSARVMATDQEPESAGGRQADDTTQTGEEPSSLHQAACTSVVAPTAPDGAFGSPMFDWQALLRRLDLVRQRRLRVDGDGSGDLDRDVALAVEGRVGHVDAVLAHALGEGQGVVARVGLLLGGRLRQVALRLLEDRLALGVGGLERGVVGARQRDLPARGGHHRGGARRVARSVARPGGAEGRVGHVEALLAQAAARVRHEGVALVLDRALAVAGLGSGRGRARAVEARHAVGLAPAAAPGQRDRRAQGQSGDPSCPHHAVSSHRLHEGRPWRTAAERSVRRL